MGFAKPPIVLPSSQTFANTFVGDSFVHSLGLKLFELSTPFINNHKQNDNSPINIGIATYVNMGFANPFESNIVKLFISYPIPEMK